MKKFVEAVRRELEFRIKHNIQSYHLEALYNKVTVDISGETEITVNVNTEDPDYGAFIEYGTGMYNETNRHYIKAKHRTASGKPGFLMFPVPKLEGLKSHGPIPGNVAFRGKNKKGEDVIFTQQTMGMPSRPFIRHAINSFNGTFLKEDLI